MVIDVYQDYLLVTYRPFDVHIYHVKLSGGLTPSSTPDLKVIKCFKEDTVIILELIHGYYVLINRIS